MSSIYSPTPPSHIRKVSLLLCRWKLLFIRKTSKSILRVKQRIMDRNHVYQKPKTEKNENRLLHLNVIHIHNLPYSRLLLCTKGTYDPHMSPIRCVIVIGDSWSAKSFFNDSVFCYLFHSVSCRRINVYRVNVRMCRMTDCYVVHHFVFFFVWFSCVIFPRSRRERKSNSINSIHAQLHMWW